MPEAKAIKKMFSGISRRYDFLNHLLSLGIDRGWRRRAVRSLRSTSRGPSPGRALDLCCGTGDLTLELSRGGFEPSKEIGKRLGHSQARRG